ncbi:hypothetical protein jhhlp_002939 [Lomentospora prolificans]|uniref:lytic cellulose monooxygenase (C4-dehydrogenating) n=1 Tax=Lomentospora prolificans TaxID=41688 RepID=A0A2N3NFH3_9PEZI|nr:hypothetical protein jhhlp_002939 [Lomentospora prolificans]
MRSLANLFVASAVAVNTVAAHYIFQQFSSDGTQYPAWQYIRRNPSPEWLQNSPVTDLASKDLRCNVGGDVSNGTETLTVKAGSEFTFTLDTAVYHQGPISLYMSKAPGAVEDYDGSGPWFKIFDWGTPVRRQLADEDLVHPKHPYMHPRRRIPPPNPIPRHPQPRRPATGKQATQGPPGHCLTNSNAGPQFYISCAQINVIDGGSKEPSPTALIPGAFKATDPGYTANIYSGDMSGYVVPGPSVFSC